MSASVAPPRWLAWVPVITAAGLIIGALLTIGGVINQVREQDRRITVLEQRDEQLRAIDARTTRIEAKLEVLAVPNSTGSKAP
ncbi:hypothetical protein NHF48_007305 [Sphingomonas sp. H160509]|jgi:hypothetical protein|uniref:hypothetical protein n=1 Tax=Sphingomonas sp. H160509 TaxID=2955313 RepID=UPI0020982E3C|nr:hypothetical protein [Sphingomonas sp. H160509]MDD1450808.1 hypothetical protein [Sphingomonas sp. H160509]